MCKSIYFSSEGQTAAYICDLQHWPDVNNFLPGLPMGDYAWLTPQVYVLLFSLLFCSTTMGIWAGWNFAQLADLYFLRCLERQRCDACIYVVERQCGASPGCWKPLLLVLPLRLGLSDINPVYVEGLKVPIFVKKPSFCPTKSFHYMTSYLVTMQISADMVLVLPLRATETFINCFLQIQPTTARWCINLIYFFFRGKKKWENLLRHLVLVSWNHQS
jgi:hypothetical protein